MDQSLVEKCCVAVGAKGQGKTTRILKEIASQRPKYRAVFCFDHKHQVSRALGKPLALTTDDLKRQIADVVQKRSTWVCYSPHKMFPTDILKGFDFFCNVVADLAEHGNSKEPKAIYCEEWEEVVPPHDITKYKGILKVLNSVRVYYVHGYYTSQQFKGLHNKLRFQASKIFAFKHDNADSVAPLSGYGIEPKMVAGKERGSCVTWESGRGIL